MGSSSQDFFSVFSASADASGRMDFARFMELALYDPQVGYYRRPDARIGYGPGTDFFTASTSPIFGELVAAACVKLLGPRNPAEFSFVELGPEPGRGVLRDTSHPFKEVRSVPLGGEMILKGPCVVFANELFDAQPFHRFVRRGGAWREWGVSLSGGTLVEVELAQATPAPLPVAAPEGYRIDAPVAAASLLERAAAQPWTGLFVTCDYGKTERELFENTPAGTARAYYRHTQSNDLLARPGDQDLTCHVCWDWLERSLVRTGFSEPVIQSQEAFFVHHAGDTIAAISAAEAGNFGEKKRSLLQLLHPAHLGQKFQVLHSRRGL